MDSKELISRIEGELGSAGGRDPSSTLHPAPRVADHDLVRRIGAGSYGEVWLARAVTGQWRAVKAVSRDRFSSDRPYEREFRGVVQFEPISRSHSGLVHVLHVGRDDQAGAFYYVMELADAELRGVGDLRAKQGVESPAAEGSPVQSPNFSPGEYRARTLRSDLKARGRLAVAECVELGVELTGALGHIHRHGLVHRDVKPSNVIFVQGRPKLADLGLVTSTSEARSFVGTEGFIPPEGPGTVKADLFALGRLLYEAVTGKDRCEFPELPSDLDSWPNREEFLEFNEIVTQLCAPEPGRRYANAAEVAGDLNLILAGRSVRRANGIERRLAQARRISAMTLVGLAICAGVVLFQQSRQREAEQRAAHERSLRERAENAERDGRQQLYTALLEQARATVRGGELGQRVKALDAVHRAAAITNTPELRREALTALTLPDLRWQRDLPLGAEFTLKEPDPEFARVAVGRARRDVELVALSNMQVLATLPASTNLHCYGAVWRRDGKYLAVKREVEGGGGDPAVLEVWELSSPPRRVLLIRDARHSAFSFHPQLPEFIAAVGSRSIVNWSLETGEELGRMMVEVTPVFMKHAPDGRSVAAAYPLADGWGVSIHDTGKAEARVLKVFPHDARTIEWDPRGRWLAVADFSGAVHLMDRATGDLKLLGRHRAEAVNAVFCGEGDYLLTGGWERALICWDLRTMQRAFELPLDAYIVRARRDGSAVAVLKEEGIKLYSLERPNVVRELPLAENGRVRHAAFAPDGRALACSTEGSVNVWNLQTRQSVTEPAHGPRLYWSAEGTELVASSSASGDGSGGSVLRWRVWDAGHESVAPALEKLPVSRPPRFNSMSVISNRVVWTTAEASAVTTPENFGADGNEWKPTSRGINGQSPDGRWLGIYVPYTPRLKIYRLPELELVTVITNGPRISGFCFSSDGRELVVAARGRLTIYETETWQLVAGTSNAVGLAYVGGIPAVRERGLWMADNTRTAGMRDPRTFESLLPLPLGHLPLALSADGLQLAVSVDARRVAVWDLLRVREELRALELDWTNPSR